MLAPREVADIQQHGKVVDIAAGRRHTLVLVVDDTFQETGYKAFGFGANELQQLGLDEDHPASKRAYVMTPVAIRPLEGFHAFKARQPRLGWAGLPGPRLSRSALQRLSCCILAFNPCPCPCLPPPLPADLCGGRPQLCAGARAGRRGGTARRSNPLRRAVACACAPHAQRRRGRPTAAL